MQLCRWRTNGKVVLWFFFYWVEGRHPNSGIVQEPSVSTKMAAQLQRCCSHFAKQLWGDFCDGDKKVIDEPSFTTSMEWDMQVVKGSSLLSPAVRCPPAHDFCGGCSQSGAPCSSTHSTVPCSLTLHLPWDLWRALGSRSFSRVTVM